jgi:pimeloyl-ACP methyl ester carboxylesterase
LSGWSQNYKSLEQSFCEDIVKNFKISSLDYSQFNGFADLKNSLKSPSNPEIIIGWSLGGQIAARLIADKIFSPQLLVLVSAPFQFVKSSKIAAAMPKASFEIFRNNFIKNSSQTLEKFSLLMMLNNAKRAKAKRVEELAKNLYVNKQNYTNLIFWLEELERFSCFELDFNNFPRTLIFQGKDDLVVHASQSQIFASKIYNSRLELLPDCGHCPHISNLPLLTKILIEETNLIL